MLFTQKWFVRNPQEWKKSWSNLIQQFDSEGYELSRRKEAGPEKSDYELLIPGLDSLILQGSVQELEIMATLRRFTWEKVRLKIDEETGIIHTRFVYWSPLQILMHALITFMVGFEAFSGAAEISESFFKFWAMLGIFIFLSFIPVALSLREMVKLEKKFEAAGFSARREK